MAINPEDHQTLIDRLVNLFQSNEASVEYGQNPGDWVDENLPEGTEAADVAHCMPEVADRLGGPYQQNLSHYNASGQAATHSVVNEISYTYNTVYQQNAFIYAEEGAQVTNIQGDGNTVTQVDIDDSFNVDHEEEAPEAPEDTEGEYPEDTPPEDPEGEYPEDTPEEEAPEDPEGEYPEDTPGWEDPIGEDTPPEDTPPEDVPEDLPEEAPADLPEA